MQLVIVRRRVNFSETDMAGVMHFSNYLRWAEDAEHALWRSIGLTVHQTGVDGDLSWPRIAVECNYHTPLRFEDDVEMRAGVAAVGGKSVTFLVEFHRGGEKVAQARTTAVCCRIGGGRFASIEIPADIREKLKAIA